MTPTPSREEMLAAETPVRDRAAYFWQLLSTEHVRIRVDLRREIGHDAPDGPTVYWDCSSFSNDVAKALLAECLAVSASDGVQGRIPDGQQCNEQSAQGLSLAVAKFERDGKIAVLVSPGFGAGWSTWNDGEECVFDPEIVQAVLARDLVQAEAIAKRKYPEHYTGGVDDLIVVWVNKGDRFEIHEYDGNESLRVFGPTDGYVA